MELFVFSLATCTVISKPFVLKDVKYALDQNMCVMLLLFFYNIWVTLGVDLRIQQRTLP